MSSGAEAIREFQTGIVSFLALRGPGQLLAGGAAAWTILGALVMALGVSFLFLRMASLLAPRNLFASFLSLFSIISTVTTVAALLFIQLRIVAQSAVPLSQASGLLHELHRSGYLLAGFFLSLTLLTLRPYFRVQASPWLSALTCFPASVFCVVLARDLSGTSRAALPEGSPASFVFFAVLAVLFVSIALHCIRHRHLFLEMTNLRELLDVRDHPPSRPRQERLGGGVAFDA